MKPPGILTINGGSSSINFALFETGDPVHLKATILAALRHKDGFALVDILQPCVSFNKVNTYRELGRIGVTSTFPRRIGVTSTFPTFVLNRRSEKMVGVIMARPLRIQNDGGWYHVINRGIDRSSIYRDQRDRKHFLELLETASGMHMLEVHGYVFLKESLSPDRQEAGREFEPGDAVGERELQCMVQPEAWTDRASVSRAFQECAG